MIGKKLKELLKEKDIKQIRLAEAVGISQSRLSNYLSDSIPQPANQYGLIRN